MANFKREDLTGKKFYELTVLSYSHSTNQGTFWLCKCECGKTKVVRAAALRFGHTRSCGCLQKRVTQKRSFKHGLYRHPIKDVWCAMMQRCYNPKNPGYKNYGGRGIEVCKKWHTFQGFISDMYETWEKGLSIERKENNKGYYKGNCKWATYREQCRNQRRSHKITINGETLNVSQWSERMGFKPNLIHGRIRKGWSKEEAVLTPLKKS